MRRSSWLGFAFVAIGLVGCGGSDSTPDRIIIGDTPDAGGETADANVGPDAVPFQEECNTTTQNCLNPDTPKCTMIVVGDMVETECVEQTGTVAADEVCVRVSEGNGGVGRDDCAIGLFCSGLGLPPPPSQGVPPPERRCREFCDSNLDCVTSQKCLSLDGTGPVQGLCVPFCALFGSDCDAVAANMSCSLIGNNDGATAFGICRGNGTVPHGGACMSNLDCQPNMNCISDGTCAALCDNTHACPGGTSCTPVSGVENGGGFCQ
jgi:hypothetical protein